MTFSVAGFGMHVFNTTAPGQEVVLASQRRHMIHRIWPTNERSVTRTPQPAIDTDGFGEFADTLGTPSRPNPRARGGDARSRAQRA